MLRLQAIACCMANCRLRLPVEGEIFSCLLTLWRTLTLSHNILLASDCILIRISSFSVLLLEASDIFDIVQNYGMFRVFYQRRRRICMLFCFGVCCLDTQQSGKAQDFAVFGQLLECCFTYLPSCIIRSSVFFHMIQNLTTFIPPCPILFLFGALATSH